MLKYIAIPALTSGSALLSFIVFRWIKGALPADMSEDLAHIVHLTIWLPFGVKIVVVWLYRWKGIAYLLPTGLLNIMIFSSYFDVQNIGLHILIMTTLDTVVLGAVFLAVNMTPTRFDQPLPKHHSGLTFLLAALTASFGSKIVTQLADPNVIFKQQNSVLWLVEVSQLIISDFLGLLATLLVCKVTLALIATGALIKQD
ncbi:hypothetical protein B9057_02615 [Aestuarium zhoushanense]|nr:hypothetical protein B9057_02615 [Aestuarium zhoushanense]